MPPPLQNQVNCGNAIWTHSGRSVTAAQGEFSSTSSYIPSTSARSSSASRSSSGASYISSAPSVSSVASRVRQSSSSSQSSPVQRGTPAYMRGQHAAYAVQPAVFAELPADEASLAQVVDYYYTADDCELSLSYAARTDRPTRPPVGGYSPVGDAVVPLLVCVAAFGIYRFFHKRTHKKSTDMKNLLQLFLHRYTKRGVVSLFALLFASVLLPLQAQDLSVFDGDTISLSYNNRYVTATSSTALGSSTTLSLGSLWRVHVVESGNTEYLRLENVNYGGYLLIERKINMGNTTINFSLKSDNSALLSLGSTTAVTDYDVNAYCSTSVVWTNGGTKYQIYTTTTTSGLTADNNNNNARNMRIEQWRSYKTSSLSIQPVDFGGSSITPSITFPFVDDNADAAEARLVYYQVAQTTTEYIAAIAGQTATKLDPKTETTYPTEDVELSMRWKHTADTVSYLRYGDNRVNNDHPSVLQAEDYHQKTPDTLIHVSKTPELINSENSKWRVTVTPVGESPLNLMQNNSWIDYQDTLVATVTYGGNTASHNMTVTRTAGHYTDVTALDATITPYFCYFAPDGKTLDGQEYASFHIDLTFRQGLQVLGKDNNVLLDNSESKDLSLSDLKDDPVFSLRDRNDVMNADNTQNWWGETPPIVLNKKDTTLTVTLPANEGPLREGMMLGAFAYFDGENTYYDYTQTLLIQRSLSQSGSMAMIHQTGKWNTSLDTIGRQDVHTIEKTIYYVPGSTVLLPVNEGCFYGYWRWYDYKTDQSAFYDEDGNFANVYQDGIDDFKWIGTDGDDIPHGIYLTDQFATKWQYYMQGKATATSTAGKVALPQPSPTINTWADGQERYIACDISNYTDYKVVEHKDATIQDTLIEPTLSYRQIFHLLDAKHMADSLTKCINTPYETHSIMAPTGSPILLSTDFAHYVPIKDNSELCYFFYGGKDGKTLCRVGKGFYEATIVASAGAPEASYSDDFIQVKSTTTGTYTYNLKLLKGTTGLESDIWLAHFEVEFVDPKVCGPSTETIIDNETIMKDYLFLAKEDFNYDAPGTPDVTYYNQHLPWGTSTYGYAYPKESSPTTNRKVGDLGEYFPFYGEYCLLNKTDGTTSGTWLKTVEQRGGAENGYCMYADGTQRPGLVAVVETPVNICSGQQLYCSAWLCNPASTSGTNPRFLIKVQGRNTGGEWETIQQIMTGEIPDGGKWHQVNVPLKSTKDYAESRVAFYNFAANNSGNDFLIDDIYLYATHIPIQAFQATTSCVEDNTEVIIIRIDYTMLTDEWAGQYVYYQIYDGTDDEPLTAHYYMEDETDGSGETEYGYIKVPAGDYAPLDGEKYESLAEFVDSVANGTQTSGVKGYISITEQGKTRPVFYMAEVVRKDQLIGGHDYFVRVGSSVEDLDKADCARTTPLVMKPKSELVIGGESSLTTGLCANNRYPVNVLVSNQVVVGNTMQTVQGEALADWLVAYAFDDCYLSETDEPTEAQKTAANEAFQKRYDATRGYVIDAIQALRRADNPYRLETDALKLKQVESIMTSDQVRLIRQLVEDGRLILGQSTMSPYLTSQDTARYWVFPISGTATATNPETGEELTLEGCEAPQMIRLCVNQSDYVLMLGPLDSGQMGEQLSAGYTPGVRVSENEANTTFSVDVGECKEKVGVYSGCRVVETNDPQLAAMMEKGDTIRYTSELARDKKTLTLVVAGDNKVAMRAGYEYTVCIRMYDASGSDKGDDGCEVGYSYVVVKVLPETLVWTHTVSNDWSDDRNWRARSSDGTPMDYGYAPIASTDVVIPTHPYDAMYPCITGNNLYPADSHYSSHACRNIRFCAGAKLLNQHLLDYNRAFVDMTIESALWHAVSTPLMDTYSGDFFIPHSGTYENGENLESKEDFEVAPFAGTRTWDAAYAFYVAYYNRSVEHYAPSATSVIIGKAEFKESNVLNEEIDVAQGFGLQGWGMGNDGETLTIRLPKGDTEYSYYNNDTGEKGSSVSVGRPYKGMLAFPSADANSASDEMQITLNNTESDKYFLFGNPTMAYINMSAFLEDNSDKVETTLTSFDEASIKVDNQYSLSNDVGGWLLPPMRAVLLTAKSSSETLTLTLKAEHLTTGTATAVAQQMPRMRKTAANTTYAQMNITAYTPINDGATKAEAVATAKLIVSPSASNGYVQGEDAPFLSSGVETESYIVTPLNLYTLAGEQSLALDVRSELKAIPLGFVIDEDLRSAYSELVLAFSTSLTWDAQCYLCDTESDKRIPLCNDLQVRIPMPTANHELRYYIEGPAYSPAGPDTPTSQPGTQATETAEPNTLAVISNAAGSADIVASAPMEHVRVYDVAGRTICDIRLDAPAPMLHLTLPSGVAIVEATLTTGETLYQKAYIR